jgi:hypothetical protein
MSIVEVICLSDAQDYPSTPEHLPRAGIDPCPPLPSKQAGHKHRRPLYMIQRKPRERIRGIPMCFGLEQESMDECLPISETESIEDLVSYPVCGRRPVQGYEWHLPVVAPDELVGGC